VDQIVDSIMRLPEDSKIHVLAPIVRERKGEYKKLLADLLAEGFTRARVDGEIQSLEDVDNIELERYVKHNIDVLVDRLVIRKGIEERLSESVETALEKSGGTLTVQIVDGEEMTFSENLGCSVCGIGFEEMEPAAFSFNSPQGACPECHGLGTSMEFDPDLIVPDKTLTLAQGAIEPWDSKTKDGYYMQSLESLARYKKFSMDVPFGKLDPEIQHIIFYGSEEPIPFSHVGRNGGTWRHTGRFKGVIANLSKVFESTESETSKDRMQRYISTKPCHVCQGKRLKPASLAVTVDDHNIIQITGMSVEEGLHFFEVLETKLNEREYTIARLILKEIKARLGVLVDVALTT
jgi:excinuclease ABC subunit A